MNDFHSILVHGWGSGTFGIQRYFSPNRIQLFSFFTSQSFSLVSSRLSFLCQLLRVVYTPSRIVCVCVCLGRWEFGGGRGSARRNHTKCAGAPVVWLCPAGRRRRHSVDNTRRVTPCGSSIRSRVLYNITWKLVLGRRRVWQCQ